MDLSSSIRRGHPIAFSLLIVLSLVVAIISSAVVGHWNSTHQPHQNIIRDTTRFWVFTGWWSFLFAIIYVRANRVYMLTATDGPVPYRHRWLPLVDCQPRCLGVYYMGLLACRFGFALEQGR